MKFVCQIILLTVLVVMGISEASSDELSTEAKTIIESKAAAATGKNLYLVNCQQCHDADGRAMANIDVVASNLTAPDTWSYGTEPINIFNNIKYGAGLTMPAFQETLTDREIWHIVAHILNIGPEDRRPAER